MIEGRLHDKLMLCAWSEAHGGVLCECIRNMYVYL